MMKMIRINKCMGCPWIYVYIKNNKQIMNCDNIDKPIDNANIIQEWCPLDNYEPSIGDLTSDDFRRINVTAEAIKNAKNVKDGRYGG